MVHYIKAFIYFFLRKTVGKLLKIFWIKEYSGLENIPLKGPAILAFNHESYFDFLCFMAISPRNVFFLSAEKFYKSLPWRILMVMTGQIKVERLTKDKREIHTRVINYLKRGEIIGIFPEGTRASDKINLLRGYPGVAKYAFWGRAPVIPVGIIGTFDVMSRHDSKPAFKKIIRIKIGKPIDFNSAYGCKMNKQAYWYLTHKIMKKISKLSQKKYPYEFNPKVKK